MVLTMNVSRVTVTYWWWHRISLRKMRGPPDELDGRVTAFRFPSVDDAGGQPSDESITIAAGTIRQSVAEELTGEEGLDAMRAVVHTEEYADLIEIVQSFRSTWTDSMQPRPPRHPSRGPHTPSIPCWVSLVDATARGRAGSAQTR